MISKRLGALSLVTALVVAGLSATSIPASAQTPRAGKSYFCTIHPTDPKCVTTPPGPGTTGGSGSEPSKNPGAGAGATGAVAGNGKSNGGTGNGGVGPAAGNKPVVTGLGTSPAGSATLPRTGGGASAGPDYTPFTLLGLALLALIGAAVRRRTSHI